MGNIAIKVERVTKAEKAVVVADAVLFGCWLWVVGCWSVVGVSRLLLFVF